MDHLGTLAAFCAETPSEAIPADVLTRTALILADSVGAIVGGAAEPDIAALRARPFLAPPGPALLLGTEVTTTPAAAALINGTAGTVLEMDEGNQFARGHPGMHVVPAALSLAAARGAVSGRDLLAAVALGYEAAARVGIATRPNPAMHPHGTWGAIGAAVAVQRLMGANAAQMRTAMNMAASLGLTTSRRTMLEGGTVRNAFTGLAAQAGVIVGDMVAAGFTADAEGVAHVYGHVAGSSFDAGALTVSLGVRWEVARNYFKMHSCCRYNHAALDALAQIRAERPGLSPDEIERVEVATYSLAVELDDPAPANVLGAKFSVPFAVATALVTGSTGVESFTQERVDDPEIRALASRVGVREDKGMTAALPDKRPALVTLHLAGGETLTAATETNRGDWADPYPPGEIRDKYLSLTRRLWPEGAAIAVWDDLTGLSGGEADALFTRMARAATPETEAV
ncbi:MmgE/PrpD family protein [Rhodovulum sp. 12E13]|uniref:MmgE/PrpD family protein n=1 Tax=Rhodovulum sp. 12E13 TaxID=2203891 RepID=UPI000E135B01|nr:MmgE/PrpD family protein [Rhodovulum sp. 12E13]RDC75221.1 MmgE/PrpD family protein [Rhodovulum sp. 12E13]